MDYIVLNYVCDREKYIREEVFIKEQGFINEFDELDNNSYHLLYKYNNEYVGVCRFYKVEDKIYKLGRVAVLKEFRNQKIGIKMIECVINYIKNLGGNKIVIDSQLQAKYFYSKINFKEEGDIFYDEGCLHIKMIKNI